MVLLADSGSTKCDWVLLEGAKEILRVKTMGLNPNHVNSEKVYQEISETVLADYSDKVERIYFFGSGCSSKESKQIIETPLKNLFTKAHVHVSHDLEGAALATCKHEPGIVCILGTGSNACYFDGEKIADNGLQFGLGYILGDEGSGCYIGKLLIKNWYSGLLTEDISAKLKAEYNLTRESIIENVYKKPGANVYLASFTKFVSENIEDSSMMALVTKAFTDFIQTHIPHFKNYKTLPIHFTGSIAYIFRQQLLEVLEKEGLIAGNIVKEPIDGIIRNF